MGYKHGKNGRVAVQTDAGPPAVYSNLKCIEWDGDDAVEGIHATNTESGGFQEMSDVGGIESMNGSVTAILIAGTPPPLRSGSTVALQLFEGGKTAAEEYSFSAFISNVKRHNVVKSTDPLTYSFQYQSSGPITRGSDVA